MKIFIDTNIFLRYLLADVPAMYEQCVRLFHVFQDGSSIPCTSSIVLLEYQYVITNVYKQPKSSVLEDIEKILQIRNLIVIDKTDMLYALAIYRRLNIKFGDCLIASQIPNGAILCTYDADFTKIRSLKVSTPDKIVQ